jgi:hypothetical protein
MANTTEEFYGVKDEELKIEFLHDGKLVYLTGRYVVDTKKASGKKVLMVEIIPVSVAHTTGGKNKNFNRFVKRDSLKVLQGDYKISTIMTDSKNTNEEN